MSSNDHYVVISADGHVTPRMETLRHYCPHQFIKQFDAEVDAYRSAAMVIAGSAKLKREDIMGAEIERFHAELAQHEGLWDEQVRRRDMDSDGVAAEVVFHGAPNSEQVPFISESVFALHDAVDPQLEAVGCRIYNRWLADFVAGAPDRYAGVAMVPMSDLDAAVTEVRWAREHGLRAVNFPAPRTRYAPYTDRVYEAFWATCADTGMPLVTHSGGGDHPAYTGPATYALFHYENAWLGRRGLPQLIFSGVFERHPNLTFILTELYGAWVSEFIRDMDDIYFARPQRIIREFLPHPPSRYWQSNCFAGVSFMSHHEAALFGGAPGTEVFLWGSDYPHAEGTFPFTRSSLQMTFEGIDAENVRAMLAENAAKAYGFDLDRLQHVADQIGPTEAELAAGPTYIPRDDEYIGLGFRTGTGCYT